MANDLFYFNNTVQVARKSQVLQAVVPLGAQLYFDFFMLTHTYSFLSFWSPTQQHFLLDENICIFLYQEYLAKSEL